MTPEDKINAFLPWTDKNGVTHIHVSDLGDTWELVNKSWVAQAPF